MASPSKWQLKLPHIALWLAVLFTIGELIRPILDDWLTTERDPNRVFHHNELRIGLDPTRPPFAFFADDGRYIGLEVDLGEALGEHIGMPVRFVGLSFDGLYDALKTDQVDMVIAGLQPVYYLDGNDAIYSRHYFNAGLVLTSTNPNIKDMRDIPDHTLAYEFGSPADAEAHRWLRRVLPFELHPYELPHYALDAVRVGDADAALVDAATARLYLRDHPTMNAHWEYITNAWYTVTTRADRPDILNVVNITLRHLSHQGTLDAILDEWL